jgi:hypothetical protein
MTPPTITGAVVNDDGTPRTANGTGWYRGVVRVRFTCSDALSGVAACPADQVLTGDGAGQSASGSVLDLAGNAASATVTGISIDSTPPQIAFGSHPASYTVDQNVSISCTPSDALSGLASSTCQNVFAPASSFVVGLNTLSASATDKAGNAASASTTFTVKVTPTSLCAVTGRFLIDTLQAKYGQTIPAAVITAANKNITAMCSQLPTILNPTAKAAVIAAFDRAITLATGTLFTPTQATTLTRLVAGL